MSNYSLICKSEERTMTHGRFICLFCKNRHRTYSYRKFLSHLNIQGIQDPFNKFPLHSCKVKAISLYFWFCFLLLFIQFHCHKKCKNGSKQNELEHKNKPSFCSLLVRKACKKKGDYFGWVSWYNNSFKHYPPSNCLHIREITKIMHIT